MQNSIEQSANGAETWSGSSDPAEPTPLGRASSAFTRIVTDADTALRSLSRTVTTWTGTLLAGTTLTRAIEALTRPPENGAQAGGRSEHDLQQFAAALQSLERRIDRLERETASGADEGVEAEPAGPARRKAAGFGEALGRARQVADSRGLSSAPAASKPRKVRR